MDSLEFLENDFFEELIQNQRSVSVYLKNNIRLKGKLLWHSKEAFILYDKEGLQMIHKISISAICPALVFESV